jgi:hypothetical protein
MMGGTAARHERDRSGAQSTQGMQRVMNAMMYDGTVPRNDAITPCVRKEESDK